MCIYSIANGAFFVTGLIACLTICYSSGPDVPAFDLVGVDAFECEIVKIKPDAIGFTGGAAGKSIRSFERRDLIAGDIAYLPDDMIPFVVTQDQRGLAFLSEKTRQLFHSIVED